MHSSILIGALAALSHTASGLVFRDKLTQDVNGQTLYIQHGAESETSVKFGAATDLMTTGWEFNTEGYPDDVAIIRPLDSSATLVCEPGSKCTLDPNGRAKQPFRLTRPNSTSHVFTVQDAYSSLYVCRSSDLHLYLESSETVAGSCHFTLETITVKGTKEGL